MFKCMPYMTLLPPCLSLKQTVVRVCMHLNTVTVQIKGKKCKLVNFVNVIRLLLAFSQSNFFFFYICFLGFIDADKQTLEMEITKSH